MMRAFSSDDLLKFPKVVLLLFVFTFANFMALLFTPALPELASDFHIAPSNVSWAMTIFLIGYCIGQLPYGPLANRFGRKQALTIGAIIAFLGTLLACFTNSFSIFLLARFLQAIGSSAGLKIVFTMIGDLYQGEKAAKAMAMLSLAFGFVPALAVAIGGYVTTYAGWRGCFIFLAFYTVVLWLLSRLLPETAKETHKDALALPKIGAGYLGQLKDRRVVLHAFLAGLTTASFYIFATLSPHIAIKEIGLSPDHFGLFAIVPTLGLCVGAFCSRGLSAKNPRHIMLSGIIIFLLSTTTFFLLFANGIVNVWSLFIPPFFLYLGNNLTWSRALAQGMSVATDKSNASAIMQCINVGTAMIGVFCLEMFPPTAVMLMPIVFGIIGLLLLIVWFRLGALDRAPS